MGWAFLSYEGLLLELDLEVPPTAGSRLTRLAGGTPVPEGTPLILPLGEYSLFCPDGDW